MKLTLIVALAAISVALAAPRISVSSSVPTVTQSTQEFPQMTGLPGRFHRGWWSGLHGSGPTNGPGGPGGWWANHLGFSVSSTQSSSTSLATSAAEFYTAAPTSSQVTLTSLVTTSTQAPTSTSVSQTSPAAPSESNDTQGDDPWQGDQPYSMSYAQPILTAHNSHRRNHSVPLLKWSRKMEEAAKQIADTCVYAHSKAGGDGNYGQNIGAGYTAQNSAGMVTNAMYNDEIMLYPGPYGQEPSDMSQFEKWGHYSQLVWANTQEVGCYTTDCSAHGLGNAPGVWPSFTVCNYFPAGNMRGEFGANVPKPGNLATIHIPFVW